MRSARSVRPSSCSRRSGCGRTSRRTSGRSSGAGRPCWSRRRCRSKLRSRVSCVRVTKAEKGGRRRRARERICHSLASGFCVLTFERSSGQVARGRHSSFFGHAEKQDLYAFYAHIFSLFIIYLEPPFVNGHPLRDRGAVTSDFLPPSILP